MSDDEVRRTVYSFELGLEGLHRGVFSISGGRVVESTQPRPSPGYVDRIGNSPPPDIVIPPARTPSVAMEDVGEPFYSPKTLEDYIVIRGDDNLSDENPLGNRWSSDEIEEALKEQEHLELERKQLSCAMEMVGFTPSSEKCCPHTFVCLKRSFPTLVRSFGIVKVPNGQLYTAMTCTKCFKIEYMFREKIREGGSDDASTYRFGLYYAQHKYE